MRKKRRKKKKSQDFNAYQFATEFEKLSLEVLNIKFRESFDEKDILHKDTTQETRDKGVDAFLVFKINNIHYTYTVEAKLRTSDTLSLKDFATSILYYLINTSSRHYIVTNISYSNEVLKYIKQFNSCPRKPVELIDGQSLQEVINEHLNEFYKYSPELLQFLINRVFSENHYTPQSASTNTLEDFVFIKSYDDKIKDTIALINAGCCNFVVTGIVGSGKSTWIRMMTKELERQYNIHRIDISTVQTPKLLVIEILRLLLKIDIDLLFSELSAESDSIEDIFKQFQSYDNMSMDILQATKVLISSDSLKSEDYIYMLNILVEHLRKNFLIYTNTVFIIDNLQEANAKMIQFVIKTAGCICHETAIIFWELLLPQSPSQLLYVTMEQWYNYLYLLRGRKYNQHKSYEIKLEQLEEHEAKDIISHFIPNVTITSNFVNTFIENFGTIPQDIFDNLKLIKNTKLYSSSVIDLIPDNDSCIIENYIENLITKKNSDCQFYKEIFGFTILLDGKLTYEIIDYLDSIYELNTIKKLEEIGLFRLRGNEMIFCKQYLHSLDSTINMITKKACAKWLLDNLDKMQFNHLENRYYNAFLQALICPAQGLERIEDDIQYLYHQGVYKYVIKLAKLRYEYYKTKYPSIQYYKFFISYIAYVQKGCAFNGKSFCILLDQADTLKAELSLQYYDNAEYRDINIDYAFIKYRVAKQNYDYAECEQQIDYILSYEGLIDNEEIFALARVYHALIQKEKGIRKKFIIELAEALHKYPENIDVKVSYYVNLAAMYKYNTARNGITIAVTLLKAARQLTYSEKRGHGDLEVEIGLLYLLGYKKQLDVSHICSVRLMAERLNSMPYLSKTFNLEAYYYYTHHNKSAAIECLNSAVYHSLSGGQDKQFFLFGLNLLTVMISADDTKSEEFDNVFYNIYQWFYRNQQTILKRLHDNPYFERDHMFAALVSFVCVLEKTKRMSMMLNTEIPRYYPEWCLEKESFQKAFLKNIPDYYKCANDIFILF